MVVLDTEFYSQTPEGGEIALRPAGLSVRAGAYLIDFFIRSAVMMVLGFILGQLGGLGVALILVSWFLMEWFYPVFFELSSGATPGKKRMKILVVSDDGSPITFADSFLRNLLRTADFMPFAYLFGIVSMLLNKDFKRLGDLAAGTLVVHAPEVKSDFQESPRIVRLSHALTLEEQKAFLAFSERTQYLSEDRQLELTAILKPILPDDKSSPVEQTLAIAQGLRGSK